MHNKSENVIKDNFPVSFYKWYNVKFINGIACFRIVKTYDHLIC